MRLTLTTVLALAAVALLAVTALGQGTDTRVGRASTVGDGMGGPPAVAGSLKTAAKRGGCVVRAFKSEGRSHGLGSFTFAQTPSVSGTHNSRWADFGIYSEGVPPAYLTHSLEHGAVVVHYGASLGDAAVESLAKFYAAEPGFLILAPRFSTKLVPAENALKLRRFPESGFVVTSWQRRLVCKKATPRALSAFKQFARAYRGAGPERINAYNSTAPRPADLPEPDPRTPDPA